MQGKQILKNPLGSISEMLIFRRLSEPFLTHTGSVRGDNTHNGVSDVMTLCIYRDISPHPQPAASNKQQDSDVCVL